ncbi:MAG TPA: hypothetical protein VE961_21630 [Pyrinomonadaceae bacterium]|nr:hypothetical protein [Pyrinomonadaceae bacterium]
MTPEPIHTPKRRIAKPIGLYIITFLDFLGVGVLPLLSVIALARRPEAEIPFITVLLSVGLAMTVMAGSVWACIGDRAGRWLLLGAVSLTCSLFILNHAVAIFAPETPVPNAIGYGVRIIRAAIWMGVNWWYFRRSHVVGYYKQRLSDS